MDISDIKYFAAKYRIRLGEDLKKTMNKIEKQVVGKAVIAPSLLQRIIIKAVFIVKPYQ